METTIQSWFEGLFSAVQKSTVKPMPNKFTKPKKLYTFKTGNIVEFLGQNNKNNLWKIPSPNWHPKPYSYSQRSNKFGNFRNSCYNFTFEIWKIRLTIVCILTSKQVLCMPFPGQNQLFGGFNIYFHCNKKKTNARKTGKILRVLVFIAYQPSLHIKTKIWSTPDG